MYAHLSNEIIEVPTISSKLKFLKIGTLQFMEVWISWENEMPVKTGETLEIGSICKNWFLRNTYFSSVKNTKSCQTSLEIKEILMQI